MVGIWVMVFLKLATGGCWLPNFPGGSADTCANVLATGVGALTWRNCMAVEYSMRLNDELQTRTGDGGRVKKKLKETTFYNYIKIILHILPETL